MKVDELQRLLISEGCHPDNFCIGNCGSASDVYCLFQNGKRWSISYTERGQRGSPIYTTSSEAEACKRFYQEIMNIEHWHSVGVFKSEAPS